MAPRRPRKNDEAVESLIRNPSSKTDFRPIGNQQVITNLMFLVMKRLVRLFFLKKFGTFNFILYLCPQVLPRYGRDLMCVIFGCL